MSTLFDRTIAQSYTELLKTASTSGVTSDLTIVEDGDATASALLLSSNAVKSSGTLEVVGPTNLLSGLSVSGASNLTGNVSMGGDLTVTGNAVIQGTLTANGGTLTLGDAETDNVVFNADINSHILPNTDNTYDLGSAAKSWRNLYLDGDLYLNGTATLNNLSITGSQTIPATTQSTDKDTGALVVEGGVGVEKNVNVGGNLAVTGTTGLTGNTSVSGTLGVTGATNLSSTLGVTGATTLSSTLGVSDTISATLASGTGLAVTANATIGGNLTVTGDLTINGTTTTLNTENLVVEDKNVILGQITTPTDVTANGGGITLKGASDKTLNWASSNAAWTSSENFDVATGKTYKVNGTDVLSNNTLGSGVTSSSLTSVGTIGTGIWQGTIINPTYGGTGVNNESKTITLGGNLTTSGAFATTLASTANTNVTLPTTGTLATLANAETLTNKTLTSPTISSIVNTGTLTLPSGTDTLVGRATTDTLTNKTLTSPVFDGTTTTVSGNLVVGAAAYIVEVRGGGSTEGAIQLNCSANTHGQKVKAQPHAQAASNTLLLPGGTTIGNSDAVLVSDTGTQTLTNKTLTTPIISSISNTGTITLPTGTDTLVGRATTDTLTNKTLTSPTINNGSLNMGSGTLVLPNASTPAQTASGSLVWNNASSLLTVGDGTARKTLVDTDSTQTLSNKTIVASPTITLGNHLSGSLTLTNLAGGTLSATLADNVTNQKVGVSRNGSAAIGTRKRINFNEGTNVTIVVSDDPTNDCVNVSVTSTGGGSGGTGGPTTGGADLREVWLYS